VIEMVKKKIPEKSKTEEKPEIPDFIMRLQSR